MSTSDSTIKGKLDEVGGKIKQGVGEAVHDQSMANRGAAQQVKGHAEQAWGSVKEAAHDVREKVVSTAQNVKEHIQAGAEEYKNKH